MSDSDERANPAVPGEANASTMEREELTGILEALLVASDVPLTLERIKATIEGVDTAAAREVLEGLGAAYERDGRAFELRYVAGGYQIATRPRFAAWVARLFRGKPRSRLSRPALETLAIVAYRQPITRAEVEAIRGVNVDGVLHTLLEKQLITVTGRRDAPGRPLVFGTTREFLAYFGLGDLRDLPEEGELEVLLGDPAGGALHGPSSEPVPGSDRGDVAAGS